jgi:hypothetical protein
MQNGLLTVQLMHKSMQQSRVRIFRNKRTRSTQLGGSSKLVAKNSDVTSLHELVH